MKDAPLMLEWMRTVPHFFRDDFSGKTIDDCIRFISESQDETESIHLAIVDDHDEYMGTVSLKHIRRNIAEFAIALRSCAMGMGYASFGMKEITDYGYRNRNIVTVYWCVDPKNRRAVRFYQKQGYQPCDAPDQTLGYTDEEKRKYLWYQAEIR